MTAGIAFITGSHISWNFRSAAISIAILYLPGIPAWMTVMVAVPLEYVVTFRRIAVTGNE